MNYLLNVFALAAALAVTFAPAPEAAAGTVAPIALSSPSSLVQLAECEDECQDYLEAREQAQEARQDAARDAAEVREEFAPQRAFERDAPVDRSASRRASAVKDDKPTAKTATNPVATAKTDSTAKSNKINTADTSEPKVVEKIVEKAMGVETETPAKTSSPKTCKQYFAAIGMTLSVPCE